MTRRPNVDRMRRAMERDEAHRLRRNPEYRISLNDVSIRNMDDVDATAGEWRRRVLHFFPTASFTSWRSFEDDVVIRWQP